MAQELCWKCKKAFTETRIGFRDHCNACGTDAHVCWNCRHYDATSYRECKESVSERVENKERNNFCEFFSLRSQNELGFVDADLKKREAMAAAEALFKKKS